ncbi:hypothetical protein POSPLADRAFT_1034747 [Postia placenta MAD-698-R-SB12]|uniref:Uncharacterized protein n=1 Tax=Postia placenta MAD-698-R-SB12 TaxID=670580 RepID=A0A1X6MY71_9APHY|nr:hypothetical protein POSPLADRAFT_1034747 [Postia placenta MAD-698-R-SB12]OSX61297.1 hypothetical protein POSPLADRAFT_1034747 [Postia placenta MAD-698-R-SB12]
MRSLDVPALARNTTGVLSYNDPVHAQYAQLRNSAKNCAHRFPSAGGLSSTTACANAFPSYLLTHSHPAQGPTPHTDELRTAVAQLNQIHYSQSNIGDRFTNGRLLENDIREFRQIGNFAQRRAAILARYPPRSVWEDQWVMLDHRRLYVMNRMLPPETEIPCVVPEPRGDDVLTDDVGQELCRKATTPNGGVYIYRRGHHDEAEYHIFIKSLRLGESQRQVECVDTKSIAHRVETELLEWRKEWRAQVEKLRR